MAKLVRREAANKIETYQVLRLFYTPKNGYEWKDEKRTFWSEEEAEAYINMEAKTQPKGATMSFQVVKVQPISIYEENE